jgi:N-acetylmuramoyl-L-alanine amidase
LTVIASRYGTTVGELVRLNALSDPNHLLVGTTLQVTGKAGQGSAGSSTPARSSSGKLVPVASSMSGDGRLQFDISAAEQLRTAHLLQRAAVEYDVPATLLMALTYTESRWRQDAVSSSGAVGVGQLLPETATWLAGLMEQPKLDVRQRADNIRMSAFLLRLLLDRTPTPTHALASYYQGIGAVLSRGLSPAGARYAAVIAGRRAWFG